MDDFEVLNPSRKWSPQQIAFFREMAEGRGNTILDARAGCGKTTTIIEGVNYVPNSYEKILFVAFNKIIAEELNARIRNPRASARTLHSLGCSIVYKAWGNTQVDEKRGQRIAHEASGLKNPPRGLIPAIVKLVSLAKNIAPFADIESLREIARNYRLDEHLQCVEWLESDIPWDFEQLSLAAHRAMELSTRHDCTIDFDDMIYLPVRMRWARPQFDMVLVDECQDMNATQILLARGVCRPNGRIVVVGDPFQAIYEFRGADSESLKRLEEELNAKRLGLTTTYRCPKTVVAVAQRFVSDFHAAPDAPEGHVSDIGSTQLIEKAASGDFVLSRKNAPLAQICLGLLRANKPALIRGRDISASFLRIIEKLKAKSVAEFLKQLAIWEKNNIESLTASEAKDSQIEYVRDQAETLKILCEGLVTTSELVDRIKNLFSELSPKSYIVCSSIHKAKGLETDRVFLLMDTLYPGGSHNKQEERNIHYVAVTRAKNELVQVHGEKF